MAHGKLATASIAVGQQTVYTAPVACLYANVDIIINNSAETDNTVKVAVTPTPVEVTEAEWIESKTVLKAGGTLTLSNIKVSPGESVVVGATVAGSSTRVMGSELTSLQ